MSDPFVFEWAVDQHGYELVHVSVEDDVPAGPRHTPWGLNLDRLPQTLLTDTEGYDVVRPRGGPLKYYLLDDKPGLWRRFTETCTSIDGALLFINEFGLLRSIRDNHGELPTDILGIANYVLRISAFIDSGDRKGATELIRNNPPQVAEMLFWNERTARSEQRLVPHTLRDALLHQAAETITGNRRWRHCRNEGCPEWFQLGQGAHTERREFCSDRCRVASARKQRARAEGMRAHA